VIRWFARAASQARPGRRLGRELVELLIGLGVLAFAFGLAGVVLRSSAGHAIGGVTNTTCLRGQVALTFDGGPGGDTAQIIRVLRAHSVRATFFVTGNRVTGNAALIRAAIAAGDEVENNGWDHAALGGLSLAHARDEITRTQRAVIAAGGAAPTMIRLPHGSTSERLDDQVRWLGLKIMQYSIDSGDRQGRAPAEITARVLRKATDGAVVLLHDGPGRSPNTVAALPDIIEGLRSKGFCMALVSSVPTIGPGLWQNAA